MVTTDPHARAVEAHELFVGAMVMWLHVPRGGYGYVFPVDAKVLGVHSDRARIEVTKADGEIVRRTVRIENLRWRKSR